ncbi:hypothetical protein HDU98_005178, partial [Podochytrium sp. JEL0797]
PSRRTKRTPQTSVTIRISRAHPSSSSSSLLCGTKPLHKSRGTIDGRPARTSGQTVATASGASAASIAAAAAAGGG